MDRLMVSVSGVRGTVGGTLTPEVACRFACAFGTMLVRNRRGRRGKRPTVVLGRDTRPSGPMLRNAVAAGLLASGVNVVDLGVVTTPGAALMTARLRADGGAVITASHNPAEYNGMKFLQSTGTGLAADQAGRLAEIRSSGEFFLADTERLGVETTNSDTHRLHVQAVCRAVDCRAVVRRRFKVVLDSVNGAGCAVTPMLLKRLGCRVAHLNAQPHGRFAHPPEPIEPNLKGLCAAVRRHKAAAGFAQDADADRLAIVDENGRFIGEEYTLALAAAFVLRHRKGKLAANMVTSRMIDDIARSADCRVVRAPTGEANVVAAMRKHKCIMGGEGGGGVIEPKVVPVRDSLVAIAYVLQYLAETGKSLSELVAEIPRYVMMKTKFPCPPGAAAGVIAAAQRAFASRAGARFDASDGLRIDLPEGWVCARASNTEPIMRIIAEAADAESAGRLVAEVRRVADSVIAGS